MVTAITDFDDIYLEVVNDGVSIFVKKVYVDVRLNSGDPDIVDFRWHWYEIHDHQRLYLLDYARFTPTTYASAAALLTALQGFLVTQFPTVPSFPLSLANGGTSVTSLAALRTLLGAEFSHTFATGTFTVLTWTDMPLALSFWNGATTGTGRYFSLCKLDLTNYTQVKMIMVKASVAGVAGANLKLRYATTDDNTAANYLTIGSSEVQTTFGTGVNQIYDTGWIDLVAGAKADVYCVILGDTGNGTADPTFHKVYALFR